MSDLIVFFNNYLSTNTVVNHNDDGVNDIVMIGHIS